MRPCGVRMKRAGSVCITLAVNQGASSAVSAISPSTISAAMLTRSLRKRAHEEDQNPRVSLRRRWGVYARGAAGAGLGGALAALPTPTAGGSSRAWAGAGCTAAGRGSGVPDTRIDHAVADVGEQG